MKSVFVTIGALASLAVAQDLSGLPQCGLFCATSMWSAAKAEELGCKVGDLVCLCKNQNFLFGIRDCSAATCPGDDARKMVEFGLQACRDVGVQITDGGNSGATSTSAPPSSSGANQSGGSASTIPATMTTGSDANATSVPTSGGSASNTGASSGTNGGLVSTVTSDSSTFVTTLTNAASQDASASDTGTSSGPWKTTVRSSASTAQAAASSTKSGGAAVPQQTFAPAAILGAGLAAFLL